MKAGFQAPALSHSVGSQTGSVQDLRQVIPEATRPPPNFLLLPHSIPLAVSQFKPQPQTNHNQDSQRGDACSAAQIPAPWGLNLPGSACALQQILLVHGLQSRLSQCALEVARRTRTTRTRLLLRSRSCAQRLRLYPRPWPPRVKSPAARRVQKPAGRGKGDRLQRESRLCPQDRTGPRVPEP